VQVLLSNGETQQGPRPYGRIRGTHELFKEEKPEAKEFGETSSLSRVFRVALITTIVFTMFTLLLLTTSSAV
jgi:hypothetical protein